MLRFATQLPINRVIAKHFCKPHVLPHRDIVDRYSAGETRASLVQSALTKEAPESPAKQFFAVPDDLQHDPSWWVMPWASLRKPSLAWRDRREKKLKRLHVFLDMLETIAVSGWDWRQSGPLPAHLLQKPNGDTVAICLDGHHRLAVLSYLIETGSLEDKVFIKVLERIKQENRDSDYLVRESDGQIIANSPSWFSLAFIVAESRMPTKQS